MNQNKFLLCRNGSRWTTIGRRKKKANRRRQQEEGRAFSNWSDLCPDLLICVFKLLSYTDLSRAKSVCLSWYSASRGCNPKQNQIPWLILFPHSDSDSDSEDENNGNNSCGFFVPDDRENVYRSRDLGAGFANSHCLKTCGSWLLMLNYICNLYLINPFTAEKIVLPQTTTSRAVSKKYTACFWIDNETKDYLVILFISSKSILYTKKGDYKWNVFRRNRGYTNFVYNHKYQKLYLHAPCANYPMKIQIWDFSGNEPHIHGYLDRFWFSIYDFASENEQHHGKTILGKETRIAVTDSGDVLMVACIVLSCYTCCFCIYKIDHATGKWVKIDSLGDEALICDTDCTVVVAKDTPGIKRNSIYFGGIDPLISVDIYYGNGRNPEHLFVFDLTTKKIERLPQWILSKDIYSCDARWFFPS